MKDLTLCVFACKKLEKRIKSFLEVGCVNNRKYKIEIIFLSSDKERPEYIDEKFKWIHFRDDLLSIRFLNFIKNYNLKSRWIMQVDDDSSTDIDKTIELLDQFYDYKDPVMLQGSSLFIIESSVHATTFMEDKLQNVLKKMNIENIFLGTEDINNFNLDPYFNHGWEQTTISMGAYNKIKKYERLDEFINLCEKEQPVFGDQPPYVLAKLAKVPISEFYYFCPFPNASEFSAINSQGRYSHIHFVTEEWDQIENFKRIIKNGEIFLNAQEAESNLENISLVNTYWKFGSILGKEKKEYGILKLRENKIIDKYENENECFWELRDNKIFFFNNKNEITTIFNKKNKDRYEGEFLKNKSIIHYLEKIKIINGYLPSSYSNKIKNL